MTKRQIVYERAEKYAKDNLEKIDVVMGSYDGSQKCQHVARQCVETNLGTNLVVTLCFVPRSGVNVHFINYDYKTMKCIDNTLGYLSKRNTYYFVDEFTLHELEDRDMSKMLMA